MFYDLVGLEKKYRGIERGITDDPFVRLKRDEYKKMLEFYFEYIEFHYNEPQSQRNFEKHINYYKKLCDYSIPCEMIVYDTKKIQSIYGYSIEFLGIDIVYDMCESLIEDYVNPQIVHLLNVNGLCRSEEDVNKIVQYQDHGGVEWKPCYVYKILINENRFQDM